MTIQQQTSIVDSDRGQTSPRQARREHIMFNATKLIAAIAHGQTSVNALTHTSALGTPEEVKNALMVLAANGTLRVYEDGRRVAIA